MTMEQIADWLQKRGMSEYAQCFIENRIDLAALADLTDQDLEKLGVLLGDRRKLLRWITDLKDIERVAPAVGLAAAGTAAGLSRTAASNGDVRRPCWFDGTLRPHGPGRSARGRFGLSERCRRNGSPLRGVHRGIPW